MHRTTRLLPAVEAIERRLLLSVSPSLVSDPVPPAAQLLVRGTDGNDIITVSVGTNGTLSATVNGRTTTYTPAQYAGGITVDTGATSGGHDQLTINSLPAVQTHVRAAASLDLTIGTDARGLQDIGGAIDFRPSFVNPNQVVNVTVNDAGDPTARQATIRSVAVPGTSADADIIHGLSAGDITLVGLGARISTGSGADTLDVSIDQLAPSVRIDVNGTRTRVNNQDRPGPNGQTLPGGGVLLEGKPGSISLADDESPLDFWSLGVPTGASGELDRSAT
jgi:hypothetical protein